MDSLVKDCFEAKDPQVRETMLKAIIDGQVLIENKRDLVLHAIQDILFSQKSLDVEFFMSFLFVLANEYSIKANKFGDELIFSTGLKTSLKPILETVLFGRGEDPIHRLRLHYSICNQCFKRKITTLDEEHSMSQAIFAYAALLFIDSPNTVTNRNVFEFISSLISFSININCIPIVQAFGWLFQKLKSNHELVRETAKLLVFEQCLLAHSKGFNQLSQTSPSLASCVSQVCLLWIDPTIKETLPFSSQQIPQIIFVVAHWLDYNPNYFFANSTSSEHVLELAVRACVLAPFESDPIKKSALSDSITRVHAAILQSLFEHKNIPIRHDFFAVLSKDLASLAQTREKVLGEIAADRFAQTLQLFLSSGDLMHTSTSLLQVLKILPQTPLVMTILSRTQKLK